MLHEFDAWLEAKYLNRKARKDRWAWNFGIQQGRPITVRENRQWKPAIAYCRYADDFVVIVKGRRPMQRKSVRSAGPFWKTA
jgi:RNA-directed DNA polymerase